MFSRAVLAATLVSATQLLAQTNAVDVPAGVRVLLSLKGDGVQVYTCSQTAQGTKWTLKAPDAKLLDDAGTTAGSHFAGPTWKLFSGGMVQGELIASQPSPQAGAIPWLLLRSKAGTATGSLATVAFIRRTETQGGAAPSTGCTSESDLGKEQRTPYTAKYTFYVAQ